MSAATPNLTQLLTTTRRRLQLELLVRVSAHALAGTVPLVIGAYVGSRLLQLPDAAWLWPAGAITLGLIGLTAFDVWRRWPSYAEAARAADGQFGTAELFASAWDARGQDGIVAQALRERAEQSALAQGTKLIRLALRQPLTILALSLVMTLTAWQLIPLSEPNGVMPLVATSPGASLDLRDDVLAVAELLERRAGEEDDAFVAAIAKSLFGLADTADIETSDAALLAEGLAELRDYARAAMDTWDGRDSAPLAEIIDQLVERAEMAAGTATGRSMPFENSSGTPETALESKSLRETIEMLGEAESSAQGMGQGEDYAQEDAGYDYDQMPVDALAAQSDERASPSTTTGAPAAPSDEASGGASAMAGDGTGELEGAGQLGAELTFEDAPELALDSLDRGEGLRVEEFILPETQELLRLDAADPLLGDHWVRQNEAEVSRRAMGASDRAVASRYRLMLRDGVTP